MSVQIIHEYENFEIYTGRMSRVTKGEKLLAELAKTPLCELTPEGAAFVRQRFDPFHDNPVKPVGYPDEYNGHTLPRIVKQSVSFNATSGGAAAPTTPWSFMIVATPILMSAKAKKVVSKGQNWQFDFNSDLSEYYGGFMVVKSPDGTNFPWPPAGENILGQLELSETDLDNMMRVTSAGFEFVDTTSELYRQGLLTTFRQNVPTMEKWASRGSCTANAPANIRLDINTDLVALQFPPNDVASAVLLPDSKQWLVQEGCYVSLDFNSDQLPMSFPEHLAYAMSSASSPKVFDFQDFDYERIVGVQGVADQGYFSIPTSPVTYVSGEAVRPTKRMPVNQTGIICSNVSPQFAGSLNAIWYCEQAPGLESADIVNLAYQSPSYDPFAMMLISKLRKDCPIAVKLRENYLGEWFFNGVKDIATAVAPWLSNAQAVGNQVVKWVDSANANNGYISPQTIIKGDVAKKHLKDKKQMILPALPAKTVQNGYVPVRRPPPGPAPKKVAFQPRPPRKTRSRRAPKNTNFDKPDRIRRNVEQKFARRYRPARW